MPNKVSSEGQEPVQALVMCQPVLMLVFWPALQRNLALSPRPQMVGPRMSKARTL